LENDILAKNHVDLNKELQDNEKIKLEFHKLLEEEVYKQIDEDVCDWNLTDVQNITTQQTFDVPNTDQKLNNGNEASDDSSDHSLASIYDKNADLDNEEEEEMSSTSFIEDDGVFNLEEEDEKVQEIMTSSQRDQKKKVVTQKASTTTLADGKKQASILSYAKN